MSKLNIPANYTSFLIIPKDDSERSDTKMPTNVFGAIILFKQKGLELAIEKSMNCMEKYLKVLQDGPDGKSKVSLGRGCLCWDCGNIGLPKNQEEAEENASVKPICKNCNSDEETNYVDCNQPDGSKLPWIELN